MESKYRLIEPEKCPQIEFRIRLIIFIVLTYAGYNIMKASINNLLSYEFSYNRFCLWYTFGNIIWIISVGFLFGLRKHCENLSSLRISNKFLILSVVILLNLLGGFILSSNQIISILGIIQFVALIYFCIGYFSAINDDGSVNDV